MLLHLQKPTVSSNVAGKISWVSAGFHGEIICNQWEFQDPKMEVMYHTRPYFVVIFTYIGLI
jgi:hypothetical protein